MPNPQNPFDLTGRVIILTGADGFLGSQYAAHLLGVGAIVVAWDRVQPHIGSVRSVVDITDEITIRSAVRDTLDEFGRIDCLVNNAAMNPAVGSGDPSAQFAPYEDYDMDLFRREFEVNVFGMMACIKHVAPKMMARKYGSIVNVASEVSLIAHDHRVYGPELGRKFKSPAYTASKTAVLGLTRQWAARLGNHNVRVNALSIGGVEREEMPADFVDRFAATTMLRRMAQSGEYCATLQYLLSDASSFMTGNNMIVDGGKHAW